MKSIMINIKLPIVLTFLIGFVFNVVGQEQFLSQVSNKTALVRLKTSSNKIQKLRSAGQEELANELQQKQDYENTMLIKSFKIHFDICPVYFFKNTDSEQVRNGVYNNLFIGEDLKPISESIEIKDYFIIDIGYHQYPGEDFGNGRTGFIIKTKEFKTLGPPKPFFVNINFELFKKVLRAVKRLNKRLKKYN